MTKPLNNLLLVRKMILTLTEGLSADAINKVPTGFNNNIIWNMGHLIAAQQGICYIRAGVQPPIAEQYLTPYRPGTKPEVAADSTEIERIKETLVSSIHLLPIALENNLFEHYTPWTTRYGLPISNIEEALGFLLFHEGLHFGSIMALKKFV